MSGNQAGARRPLSLEMLPLDGGPLPGEKSWFRHPRPVAPRAPPDRSAKDRLRRAPQEGGEGSEAEEGDVETGGERAELLDPPLRPDAVAVADEDERPHRPCPAQ